MGNSKWIWRHKGRKSKCRENQLKLYKSQNRELKNKIRKLKKHMKKLPNDKQSESCLERLIKLHE